MKFDANKFALLRNKNATSENHMLRILRANKLRDLSIIMRNTTTFTSSIINIVKNEIKMILVLSVPVVRAIPHAETLEVSSFHY